MPNSKTSGIRSTAKQIQQLVALVAEKSTATCRIFCKRAGPLCLLDPCLAAAPRASAAAGDAPEIIDYHLGIKLHPAERRLVATRLPHCLRKLLLAMLLSLSAGTALAHPHILRATDRTEISPSALLHDLASVQVIFVGELHNHIGHHQAQLSILRALRKERGPLAIGLEMFRKDSQKALDLWVGGSYPITSFLKDYHDNWSMWEKYREIFDFARQEEVKMVGLNIPRKLSAKVARDGMAALPAGERQALGNVQCVVTPEYEDFIRRSMGGHGGHGNTFLNFCEAQLLWDTMMARHLVEFLRENPKYRVVVLTGGSHAWKFGIPRQLLEQMDVSYRVVLPEIALRVTRGQLTPEVADYLWLDEGPDGWQF